MDIVNKIIHYFSFGLSLLLFVFNPLFLLCLMFNGFDFFETFKEIFICDLKK